MQQGACLMPWGPSESPMQCMPMALMVSRSHNGGRWMCFFPLDTELCTKIARIVEGEQKVALLLVLFGR